MAFIGLGIGAGAAVLDPTSYIRYTAKAVFMESNGVGYEKEAQIWGVW